MSCTRCGSSDHDLSECDWPSNIILFLLLVLVLIIAPKEHQS